MHNQRMRGARLGLLIVLATFALALWAGWQIF